MGPEAGGHGDSIATSQVLPARAGSQSRVACHFKGGSRDEVHIEPLPPQGAPGGGPPPGWGKGNTCKILFLKMKMTSKFFLIIEAICLLIKHKQPTKGLERRQKSQVIPPCPHCVCFQKMSACLYFMISNRNDSLYLIYIYSRHSQHT